MMRNYRQDFPLLLNQKENGRPLIYLDNAATTQKPAAVMEAVQHYYETGVANPYRGAYTLSAQATILCEEARAKTARFMNARSEQEIVFSGNSTESLNLIALSYGADHVGKGDEILVSVSEHHSNLLPWQRLARRNGARLNYLYLDESGRVSQQEVKEKINSRTKIVAVNHVSNVLGVENPIAEIAAAAHREGAVVVVDGAQSVPHMPVDVQALDVDFMAFSGHKMLGSAGIGVLYGKHELLERMEPVIVGGGIVEEVTEQEARFLDIPNRFEAGTPNVEGIVSLAAAIDYIERVGFAYIREQEQMLTGYALEKLQALEGIELYGSRAAEKRTGILAFNVKDVHPHDVASVLDARGITIRAGHHCTQPLMQYLGIASCCRASFYFYNTMEEVDTLAEALAGVRGWMGYES